MKQQAIFDKVAVHLFTQGVQSLIMKGSHESSCAYRGAEGKTCAIGCLISNSAYRVGMDSSEGISISGVIHKYGSILPDFITKNCGLLNALQSVHDTSTNWYTASEMRRVLCMVAEHFNLNTQILKSRECQQFGGQT
tara:strand:+ start:319 stop:729 length:411 start_codon:yes stop_codon:yes gene_type:complete